MTDRQRAENRSSLDMLTLRMEQCKLISGDYSSKRSKSLGFSKPKHYNSVGSSLSSLSQEDESLTKRRLSLNQESQRMRKETLAKLGNRQTKTVNHSKKCASCLKPLLDDGFFALGQLYHKSCFRCKICSKKLGEKFFVKNDRVCCSVCYKDSKEVCAACKDKILDDHISCDNLVFHPKCMKCQTCGELIRGKYLTYKDLPICEEDFRRVGHVCSVCDELILDSVYTIEGVELCEKDYQELLSSWPCSTCGEKISSEGHNALMVGDVRFHRECLVCIVCGRSMEGLTVTLDKENKVYCTEDYNQKFGIVCSTCKKPIMPKKGQVKAPRIRALGKDFHISCFKCEDCGLILDTGVKGRECWPIRKHTLCYRCFRRRQSESEQESD